MQRPGGSVRRHTYSLVMAGLVPAIHDLLCCDGLLCCDKEDVDARHKAGHDWQIKPFRVSAQAPQTPSCPACFPGLLAPNKDREIGGGRATRQPGQVRKEAALTRSGSGRSSVSYLFFERIAQARGDPALWLISLRCSASRLRETIICGSIDDRRWRTCNTPQRTG